MPKLGAYTEDVLLTRWLVDEGHHVAVGQVVLELETEKTNAEVEADSAGFVHHLVAAGQSVPIGATVGLIAATREEYDDLVGGARRADGDSSAGHDHPFLGYIGHGGGAAVARTAGAATPSRPAAAPEERRAGDGAPLVSPRARALLEQLGYSVDDVRDVAGSGPKGRIVDKDVAAWAAARETAPTPTAATDELTVARSIPLRGRRGTIAKRMVSSLQSAA